MLSELWTDFRSSTVPTKKQKIKAYLRSLRMLFMNIYCGITAPIIYPVWYAFRKTITAKVYRGTSWEEQKALIDLNKCAQVKKTLKANGKFWYWLWTYGDLRNPLGRGELQWPEKPNNFWNRYYENAIRNPRYTINYTEFNTANIVTTVTTLDTRNYALMHKSFGVGDRPDGKWLLWMCDEEGRWYFVYRSMSRKWFFYYGYVALGDFGRQYARFETAARITDSSYVPETIHDPRQ